MGTSERELEKRKEKKWNTFDYYEAFFKFYNSNSGVSYSEDYINDHVR